MALLARGTSNSIVRVLSMVARSSFSKSWSQYTVTDLVVGRQNVCLIPLYAVFGADCVFTLKVAYVCVLNTLKYGKLHCPVCLVVSAVSQLSG
jgi:hypothetical protein